MRTLEATCAILIPKGRYLPLPGLALSQQEGKDVTMSTSLFARDIYNHVPPSPRTALQNNPTLLVCWWCTAASLVIIGIRIFGRYRRTNRFFTEDKVMMVAVVPLVARMTLVHLMLIWGTNNTKTEGLSEADIRDREIGSRLVLAARIFYAV